LRLLSKTLTTTGKSALIVVGAAFGLMRGLRLLGAARRHAIAEDELSALQAGIDTVHLAVARLADQTEDIQVKLNQAVTKDELSQTLDRVFGQLERGVDARFEHQTRSVEALRMMVGQTDELLQRVLDGLEATRTERVADYSEAR
jgi:hypothetical protein